jgi:hypothetical protein
MAKKTASSVKDGLLNVVKTSVERLVVTSSEPADYTAVAAATLGSVAFTSTDVTGPATEGTGRKNTYSAKSAIDVDATGTANHICLVDDTLDVLLLVTTISNAQTVTEGNTMNTAAFDHVVAEAT